MNHQPDSVENLLALRRLTRVVADRLRERVRGYLATLTPLFRPRLVLGDYVQGTTRDPAKQPDAAFKELQSLHDRLVGAKPFGLRSQLTHPIQVASPTLEISPFEYSYVAGEESDGRAVLVRSPLKWVLSYSGYSPSRLKELLADRHRSSEELHQFLIHYLVLNIVAMHQTGVTDILAALHFPVTRQSVEEFGDLPVTCISSSVSTRRPSDDIILRSAELSGMDAFEEVLRLEDIVSLREPIKEELTNLVSAHGIVM